MIYTHTHIQPRRRQKQTFSSFFLFFFAPFHDLHTHTHSASAPAETNFFPKAVTSLRFNHPLPPVLSIWMIRYRPIVPSFPSSDFISIFSWSFPGPSHSASNVPPVKSSSPDVGSSSDTRTLISLALFPATFLLTMTTFPTATLPSSP